jgi:hypothetical protein
MSRDTEILSGYTFQNYSEVRRLSEEVGELRRILTSLVDVMLTEHCGTPGNWGYPLTSDALRNIKSNLLNTSNAAEEKE